MNDIETLAHFRPPTSLNGGWCLQGYAYTQRVSGFRQYLVCVVATASCVLPLSLARLYSFLPSTRSKPFTSWAHFLLHFTGQWCAMKRFFRTLTLSVLRGSWSPPHLRWNVRWIQRILCLGLVEGEFLVWICILWHCLRRDFELLTLSILLFVDYRRLTCALTRQCPGNHLVDSSIWLLIVSMLATLDISKAVDEHGNTVEPTVNFDNAVFRYLTINFFFSHWLTTCFCRRPDTFKCDIRPRSAKALSVIQAIWVVWISYPSFSDATPSWYEPLCSSTPLFPFYFLFCLPSLISYLILAPSLESDVYNSSCRFRPFSILFFLSYDTYRIYRIWNRYPVTTIPLLFFPSIVLYVIKDNIATLALPHLMNSLSSESAALILPVSTRWHS